MGHVYEIPDMFTTAPVISYAAKYHRELSLLPRSRKNTLDIDPLSIDIHLEENFSKAIKTIDNSNTNLNENNQRMNKNKETFVEEMILTYMTNTAGNVVPLFKDDGKNMYIPNFIRLRFYDA